MKEATQFKAIPNFPKNMMAEGGTKRLVSSYENWAICRAIMGGSAGNFTEAEQAQVEHWAVDTRINKMLLDEALKGRISITVLGDREFKFSVVDPKKVVANELPTKELKLEDFPPLSAEEQVEYNAYMERWNAPGGRESGAFSEAENSRFIELLDRATVASKMAHEMPVAAPAAPEPLSPAETREYQVLFAAWTENGGAGAELFTPE